jgi:hypothetical protein
LGRVQGGAVASHRWKNIYRVHKKTRHQPGFFETKTDCDYRIEIG